MESMKRAMSSAADMVTPPSPDAVAEVGEPSAADAMWAAMTISHHHTGMEMADLAARKATTEALRQLATHSRADQERDLPRLEEIARAGGKTAMPPEKEIEHMDRMHMQMLESLSGVEFDKQWITVMGGHHMAAVMMTDIAMEANTSHGAIALQKELRQKQLKELGELDNLHHQLHG